jgi:hypothetical protein
MIEGKQVPSGIGQHAHPQFDELFLFFGSNPGDNLALGGEVEFWLGEGEEAEKFNITRATGEWIPAGLVHNPHYFRQVFRLFLIVVISLTSDYRPEAFRYTPLPPEF